jgi:hypothetical protein
LTDREPSNGDETGASDGTRSRVRRYAAVVLAVLAALAIAFSVDTIWMHQRVFDTDTFVETLAPLPQDPAVSTAIATHVAEALTSGEMLENRVAEALPDKLGFLAPKFTDFVEEFAYDTTKRVIESDAFTEVWTRSLRLSHATIIGILDGDVATTDTGNVGIDLDEASELVLNRLEERGIDLFTDVETSFGEIVLIQAEALAAPHSIVNLFHTSVWLFPVIALLLAGAAVATDPDRLRPIMVFGFTTTIIVLLSVVGMRIIANVGFNSFADPIDRAAVEAIWDTLLNGYVLWNAIVGGIGLVVGAVAFWLRFDREPTATG